MKHLKLKLMNVTIVVFVFDDLIDGWKAKIKNCTQNCRLTKEQCRLTIQRNGNV